MAGLESLAVAINGIIRNSYLGYQASIPTGLWLLELVEE